MNTYRGRKDKPDEDFKIIFSGIVSNPSSILVKIWILDFFENVL